MTLYAPPIERTIAEMPNPGGMPDLPGGAPDLPWDPEPDTMPGIDQPPGPNESPDFPIDPEPSAWNESSSWSPLR